MIIELLCFVGGFLLAKFLHYRKFHVVKFNRYPLKNTQKNDSVVDYFVEITLEHKKEPPAWVSIPEELAGVAVQKFEDFAVFDRTKNLERKIEYLTKEIREIASFKIRKELRRLS